MGEKSYEHVDLQKETLGFEEHTSAVQPVVQVEVRLWQWGNRWMVPKSVPK